MFEERFRAIEEELQSRLKRIRAELEHAGNKGSSLESAVKTLLREHLPRRYAVGHGEVVDTQAHRSPQMDVVVVDDEHPLLSDIEQPGLYFVEGVAAAGEIKTHLNGSGLAAALESSVKFKELVCRRVGVSITGPTAPSTPFTSKPPLFLWAMETSVSLDAIAEHLQRFQSENRLVDHDCLDAVFVLGVGAVLNVGDGREPFQVKVNGVSAKGWCIYKSGRVLLDLLTWISLCVPRTIRMRSYVTQYYMP